MLWKNRLKFLRICTIEMRDKLSDQLRILKAVLPENCLTFKERAKFVLTKLEDKDFGEVKFFFALVHIMPLSTSACERAFSAMNRIKSKERSRMKTLLEDLMRIYTLNEGDYKRILKKTKKIAKKVVRNVWTGNVPKISNRELEKSMFWI